MDGGNLRFTREPTPDDFIHSTEASPESSPPVLPSAPQTPAQSQALSKLQELKEKEIAFVAQTPLTAKKMESSENPKVTEVAAGQIQSNVNVDLKKEKDEYRKAFLRGADGHTYFEAYFLEKTVNKVQELETAIEYAQNSPDDLKRLSTDLDQARIKHQAALNLHHEGKQTTIRDLEPSFQDWFEAIKSGKIDENTSLEQFKLGEAKNNVNDRLDELFYLDPLSDGYKAKSSELTQAQTQLKAAEEAYQITLAKPIKATLITNFDEPPSLTDPSSNVQPFTKALVSPFRRHYMVFNLDKQGIEYLNEQTKFTYKDPQMVIAHAKYLTAKFIDEIKKTSGTPPISSSSVQFIAFIIANKMAEDQAVWSSDFKWLYEGYNNIDSNTLRGMEQFFLRTIQDDVSFEPDPRAQWQIAKDTKAIPSDMTFDAFQRDTFNKQLDGASKRKDLALAQIKQFGIAPADYVNLRDQLDEICKNRAEKEHELQNENVKLYGVPSLTHQQVKFLAKHYNTDDLEAKIDALNQLEYALADRHDALADLDRISVDQPGDPIENARRELDIREGKVKARQEDVNKLPDDIRGLEKKLDDLEKSLPADRSLNPDSYDSIHKQMTNIAGQVKEMKAEFWASIPYMMQVHELRIAQTLRNQASDRLATLELKKRDSERKT